MYFVTLKGIYHFPSLTCIMTVNSYLVVRVQTFIILIIFLNPRTSPSFNHKEMYKEHLRICTPSLFLWILDWWVTHRRAVQCVSIQMRFIGSCKYQLKSNVDFPICRQYFQSKWMMRNTIRYGNNTTTNSAKYLSMDNTK